MNFLWIIICLKLKILLFTKAHSYRILKHKTKKGTLKLVWRIIGILPGIIKTTISLLSRLDNIFGRKMCEQYTSWVNVQLITDIWMIGNDSIWYHWGSQRPSIPLLVPKHLLKLSYDSCTDVRISYTQVKLLRKQIFLLHIQAERCTQYKFLEYCYRLKLKDVQSIINFLSNFKEIFFWEIKLTWKQALTLWGKGKRVYGRKRRNLSLNC